jgi:hypothetical protein
MSSPFGTRTQLESVLRDEGLSVYQIGNRRRLRVSVAESKVDVGIAIDCPVGNTACPFAGASCEGSSECPLTSSIYSE